MNETLKHHAPKSKQRFDEDDCKVVPMRREKPDLDALVLAVWAIAEEIQRESEDEMAILANIEPRRDATDCETI